MAASKQPDRNRIKELLDDLSDLETVERNAALHKLAETENPAVMQAVKRLLESHERAGTFLGASQQTTSFGPYTLDRRLGEGGFGEVWAADQTAPVRRRVAIKILKPGMDSRSILARFEAERQALAIMEHANIARVYDAGTTPEGRPYFVMEYVDGLPITNFCDEHRLTVSERLKLLLPVCRAVHHAHQKGVIHRDIKPGNVIVSIVDGAHVPKVIDFGIAKAIDRPLTEQTLFTEARAMIGTPEYMSPEQAEAGVVDIDTRADVYSLGVLMYELLAGVTPFDPKDLRRKAYGELQRIIREVDPPAPSERAGKLEAAQTIADARRTEAGRLSKIVRGELDWIVMKCLEKDRGHRYDSASALATDLENYLAGRDVLAGPPSKIYRIKKMVRRNRALVAGTAAVSVALVAGLASTLVMLREAKRQEAIAIEQRSLAETREKQATDSATRARTVSEFLERTITAADPYKQVSVDPKLSEILRYAVAQLENGHLSTQPEAQASLQTIVGRTLERLGERSQAQKMLTAAVEFRRKQSPRDDRELARVVMLLASTMANASKFEEAETLFREAGELAKNVKDEQLHDNLQFNLATLYMSQMKYDQAKPLLESQLDSRRQRYQKQPVELADLLDALGHAEVRLGHGDRAVALLQEALEIRNKFEPTDALSTAETSALLAEALGALKKNNEAIIVLEKAIDAVKGRSSEQSGTTAMLYETLGRRYAWRGNNGRAAELIRQALQIRISVDGPTHLRTARCYVQLGEQLFPLGKADEAREQFRTAWAILKDRDDYPMQARVEAAGQLAALSRESDPGICLELFEFAMKHYRSLEKPTAQYYKNTANYFNNRYLAGDYDAALRLAQEALNVATRVYDEKGPEIPLSHSYVARAHLKAGSGDPATAEVHARTAMVGFEKLGSGGGPSWLSAQGLLGEALLRRGEFDEARPHLEASLNGLKAIENPSAPVLRTIAEGEARLAALQAAVEQRQSPSNLIEATPMNHIP